MMEFYEEIKKQNGESANIHKDHRARLRASALKSGLLNMNPITVMEYFLSLSIPRKDVNPLAHRLMDRFGNFAAVIDADINDLLKVPGVGESAAMNLKILPQFFDVYKQSKINSKLENFKNLNTVLDLVEWKLLKEQVEKTYILCLNSDCKFLCCESLGIGSETDVQIDMRKLSKLVVDKRATYAFMFHNHPETSCKASKSDETATDLIKNHLDVLNVDLKDHFVLGKDGIWSIGCDKLVREYIKNDDVNFDADDITAENMYDIKFKSSNE